MSASFDVFSKLPFPGLRSYEPEENKLYFGRKKQLEELIKKIRSNKFLAIVGNAGSGKSSLVKASLIPKLKTGTQGQAGQNWRIAVCTPGNNPITNLATKLAARNVLHDDSKMDPNFTSIIEKTLRKGSLGIVEAYKNADITKENLMIIVDQFDEIFRFAKQNQKNHEDASIFINLLLNASKQRDVPIYIVITMRSGFIGSCTDFRELPETINDGQFLIPRLKKDDYKEIIVSPIKEVGANIEPELVSRIMNDMGEDFDDLPVLQHLLMRTWDAWVEECDPSKPIGQNHYEQVGGVQNALSQHADEIYKKLSDDKKIVCQRMFRLLCEKSAEGKAARRPATIGEIMNVAAVPMSALLPVISAFSSTGRYFLTAPEVADMDDKSTVYITHESLIEKWQTLSKWVDEEAESADIYVRMSAAAMLYMKQQGGLWDNPELSLGLKWLEPSKYDNANPNRLAPTQAWSLRYNNSYDDTIRFLNASEAALNKKEFTQNEDDERKRKTRALIMYLSLGFGVICLILLLLAGVAIESARRSALVAGRKEKEARLAAYEAELAKQDAAGKEFLAQTNEKRAEAERVAALDATQKAITSSEIAATQFLKARAAEADAVKSSRDAMDALKLAQENKTKAEIATVDAQKSADNAKKERENAIKTKGLSLAQSVAVKSWKVEDPDVQALLAQEAFGINRESDGKNNDAYLYEALYKAIDKMQNVKDNPNFNTLSIPPAGLARVGAIRSLVVSSKDNEKDLKIYSTGSDGWLLKWNLSTYKNKTEWSQGSKPEELARNKNERVYRTMDMSSNGKYLARGGDEEFIEIFDVNKKERILTINAHSGRRVRALEFLPDGNAVISVGDDNTIKYSNMKGQVNTVVDGLKKRISSISLSGDGQHLAGAGDHPEVSIWNIKTGQEEFKLTNPGNGANATAVAISPAGRFVAVGYQDGTLAIWDIQKYFDKEYRPDILRNHRAKINDLKFNDDGTALLAGSLDKRATLWSVWDKKFEKYENEKEFPFKDPNFQPISLDDHEDWVLSVAFSHDGKKAITGCADGKIKIYETDMMRYSEQICDMVKKNLSNKDWKKYIGTDYNGKDPKESKYFITTAKGERTPLSTCGSDYPQNSDNK